MSDNMEHRLREHAPAYVDPDLNLVERIEALPGWQVRLPGHKRTTNVVRRSRALAYVTSLATQIERRNLAVERIRAMKAPKPGRRHWDEGWSAGFTAARDMALAFLGESVEPNEPETSR